MNICIVTNSYKPLISGVTRSITSFAEEYRRRGHRVLVVAPQFTDSPPEELHTIRLPAIQNFNGSDFSVSVPLFTDYIDKIDDFKPNIVHSFHPFLLGVTAVRLAMRFEIPLVFSHHTMYEHSSRYFSGDYRALRRFAGELSIGYGNLADAVIAPSQSVVGILRSRGVESPIAVVPTGIDLDLLQRGDAAAARHRYNIPAEAFVIGHVGRLAEEKNIAFLTRCLCQFLLRHRHAHALIVGDGAESESMARCFAQQRVAERVHFAGVLEGDHLANAYAAMNVFAFTSRSETQAIVLAEAMAVGIPVVALDAPGVRDLVRDGENGRMLFTPSRDAFVAALEQMATTDPDARRHLAAEAVATAARFSIAKCADQALTLYGQLVATSPCRREPESSAWEAARRRIDVEFQLWANRANATGAALMGGLHPSRVPGLRHVFRAWRCFRRWLSRREWSVRLLNLPVSRDSTDEPGLVLLQIDGLSRDQLGRALDRGRMPFVRKLIERESYRIEAMYSGQPATTPAVLGELFFGVEQAVPAFGFRDHRTGQVVQMFQPGIASRIQNELAQQGEGLIEEGCVYCDIYSGGAADSSFCPATTGWRMLEDVAFWRRLALLLMNVMSMIRIVGMSIVEFLIAVGDCLSGIAKGGDLLRELLYVPRRVIVNVVLQETISIGAEVDVTRGVRVLHANFLGYDENAHRRGPGSLFAHFALRRIDRAIHRIWDAAHASHRRNYHVWLMSDHGQERTIPYSTVFGRSIVSAVRALYESTDIAPKSMHPRDSAEGVGDQLQRSAWLRRRNILPESLPRVTGETTSALEPTTVAIGPVGYIYWPDSLDDAQRDTIANRLISEAGVPLVMAVLGEVVWAWTARGRFRMPDQATEVLAPNHPHLPDVARDFARLCFHPDTGDFLICGWRNDALPLSFVSENGAHGGPGPHETTGFVMVPPDAPLPDRRSGIFRPSTLRRMAQTVLRRGPLGQREPSREDGRAPLRLVTYNVHSCIGLDGRLSPSRIARVLAATGPDIIALQELDVMRNRSGFVDQAEQIARALEMELHFHPSFTMAGERYGNAVLSRLPMKLLQAGPLPQGKQSREPRGALWVEIDVNGTLLHLINTHLGTSPAERIVQVEALLGPEWLQRSRCQPPLVLCGDFNAMPGSQPHRRLCTRLRDAQLVLKQSRPQRTWFGPLPLTRIDHVFVDDSIQVKRVEVPRTRLSRVASDHLPLVVDLEVEAVTTVAQLAKDSIPTSR